MKITLSTYEVAGRLMDDRSSDNGQSRWSRAAAYALAEYYQDLEESLGEELEFDPVAIRCEWTEYSTLQEIAQNYNPSLIEGGDDAIMEYLQDHTQVITLPDSQGYLVLQF
jgi:hypothetical protein